MMLVVWPLRANRRVQVSQRLKERGFDSTGDEAYAAACYAAKVHHLARAVRLASRGMFDVEKN